MMSRFEAAMRKSLHSACYLDHLIKSYVAEVADYHHAL